MAFGFGYLGEYYRGTPGIYLGSTPAKAVFLMGSRVWPTFIPFTIQNVNLTDEPVPEFAEGCWVTLLGGGGPGAGGSSGSGSNEIATGGRGGGGGARLGRFFVPRELMGEVYTVTFGAPWNYTNPFDIRSYPCSFSSGDVLLQAQWGQRGASSTNAADPLAQGITVPAELMGAGGTGGSGGSSGSSGSSGQSRTNGAGSGGGGGGGSRDNASGSGGSSGTATGGEPGGLNQRGGNGSSGVRSSRSGAGGGGGGFTPGAAASGGSGGAGGTSLARLEWV